MVTIDEMIWFVLIFDRKKKTQIAIITEAVAYRQRSREWGSDNDHDSGS